MPGCGSFMNTQQNFSTMPAAIRPTPFRTNTSIISQI
jgi:hypothetical protein